MTVLALDLASRVGWAVGTPDTPWRYGTFDLSHTSDDYGKMSSAFSLWLADMISTYEPKLIAIESNFFRGSNSYHLSGLVWDAHRVAYLRDVKRTEFPPTQIKRFAAGDGTARKRMMIEWAERQGFSPKTD